MNEYMCACELACARARAFVFMPAANVNSRLRSLSSQKVQCRKMSARKVHEIEKKIDVLYM